MKYRGITNFGARRLQERHVVSIKTQDQKSPRAISGTHALLVGLVLGIGGTLVMQLMGWPLWVPLVLNPILALAYAMGFRGA